MNDELLQCFDEYGRPSEVQPRSQVKQWPPQWWYGTVRVWLVNDACQLMISRRATWVKSHPNKWQTYFGGHVSAGATHLETAQRELHEEAGLFMPLDTFHFIERGCNVEKRVHFEGYAVRFNGMPADLQGTDGEAVDLRWMDMEEYVCEQQRNPDAWCCACTPEQRALIRDWVATFT